MSYEHPLAYLLGIEGIALLRAFTGEYDREFTESRIAEVRRLLADDSLTGVEVAEVSTVDGYRVWAETYDQPGNAAFALDEPEVRRIVDPLPPGVALDAACGTGRYAEWLADRGHRVIGVDSSPEMLERARKRVPSGEFLLGDLQRLPVDESTVDVVVCGLALTHVRDLAPVLAEFARVLRPGGHVVLADVHPEAVARGSVPPVRGPGGEPARVVSHRHLVGDYLRAALTAGLLVRGCEELVVPQREQPASAAPGPWETWPWSLAAMVPGAARAAGEGVPAMLIWHFELPRASAQPFQTTGSSE
ncbi:Methyltransferase domain-containing protein [Amycolatopsis sacchari]|uniref:Methyltransferase domain-containing protein n=1 Tax=Amycolatopsis sacchari TaxID=115433 RepID=A0A1I3YDU1_9PSEU|nr:class I SAM-dependent methyltransferase [Amycolatopsis sacchari]SFK29985.1 Methyltransferase domain-containing protein [Amycolatopsis sacchari]